MESLILLIPLALLLVGIAIRIFFWAVDDGQFDDLEGPAHSILFEDVNPKKVKPPSDIPIEFQDEAKHQSSEAP